MYDLTPRRASQRPERRETRARLKHLVTLLACLLGLGWAQPAPYALERYERASAALARSVTVFAADPVESLDALRRAKAAFTPLLRRLEPPLRQGLSATFARAETAIVNRSQTDLRVQAAVLRGGLQRTLYVGALENAGTNLPRAHMLLGVLAGDLGFSEREFAGTTQRALQGSFERRLAALSLEQLGGLGDADGSRESRYETLAQLYGQVFLVQDSPRLPERTQATLLGAIGALVADEPLAPSLTKLRAQLTQFERNAQTPPELTRTDAASTNAAGSARAALPSQVPRDQRAASPTPEANAGVNTGASTETDAEVATRADTATNKTQAIDPVADRATEQDATENATNGTAAPVVPGITSSNPTAALVGSLRSPLLIASGLLALTALGGLLGRSRRGSSGWQDAALALLLLPALTEGLIALATTLGPRLDSPLPSFGSYSLLTNPLMQTLWAALTVLAVLCLALGWRDSVAGTVKAPVAAASEPGPATATQPPATTAASSTTAPSPRAKLASSNVNWDDDF